MGYIFVRCGSFNIDRLADFVHSSSFYGNMNYCLNGKNQLESDTRRWTLYGKLRVAWRAPQKVHLYMLRFH